VQSSMLHGSETWHIRMENEVALQHAEMRMVRWMYGMILQHRVSSKGLRERLGLMTQSRYYSRTGCDGMGMSCKKETMIA